MNPGMIGLMAILVGGAGPDQISVPARLISGTITSADYPAGALRRDARGMTKVRLTITTKGRATNCTLFQSSGDAELDAKVCPLATGRMRFSPALGHDGQPIPMDAILPVRWELDPPAAPASETEE